jgi:hypothetical protein
MFDLDADRGARNDLSRDSSRSLVELTARLGEIEWHPVAPPVEEGLGEEETEALRDLGYIQ